MKVLYWCEEKCQILYHNGLQILRAMKRFSRKNSLVDSAVPSGTDISTCFELPVHIRKRISEEGKVLYTKDMYHMTIDTIISRLKKLYPQGKFHSPDPFCVLIATVLSQRTRDEVTERASEKLFSKYGKASALAHANVKDIEELIREVGFYRIKAPRVKEIARIISNDFKGKVPDEMEALLSLPGVGRKTANCVLVYGFGKDAIAVDTHVHRISNRLGLVGTKTPEETELKLREVLPKKHWRSINELLVRFGQETCRPVAPRCGACILYELCPAEIKNKRKS